MIVQCDSLNQSRLATTVCVPLTTNSGWAEVPGNIRLSPSATGLPKESVALASQIFAMDRDLLLERAGKLSADKLLLVLAGIDVMLGR